MRLALLWWALFQVSELPAPPGIVQGGIVNGASLMPATLPGGAIARGSRIHIPGVRMGPASPVRGDQANPPLHLANVTVRLSAAGRSFDAGLLLVAADRIEAVLPATAPAGPAQLTVTYEGRTSDPYDLTLVPSSPGFFTAETTPAPLHLDASPSGTVTLLATGLGQPALDVFVGGHPAGIDVSNDEACCRGVQRVTVHIPATAPTGCAVPVQARTAGGRPTNAIPVAIHAPGQPCHDAVDWFRSSVERATRAGFVVLARIFVDTGFLPHYQFDYGVGSFARQETGQRVFPPLPPLHTCTTFTARINLRQILGQARTPSEWTAIPEQTPGSRRLDAGPALQVAGPNGPRSLILDTRRHEYYSAILGGSVPYARTPPLPDFLSAGRYSVTAPGGGDVAPFSVSLPVPRLIEWTNRDSLSEITRDRGVTVEWKAARKDAVVLILAANADRFSGDSAMCLCLAPAREGRFAIPALALGNLPPSAVENELSASYLLLLEMPADPPSRIQTRGLDAAFAAFVSANARLVRYR